MREQRDECRMYNEEKMVCAGSNCNATTGEALFWDFAVLFCRGPVDGWWLVDGFGVHW